MRYLLAIICFVATSAFGIKISNKYNWISARDMRIKEIVGDRDKFDILSSALSDKLVLLPKVDKFSFSIITHTGSQKDLEFETYDIKPQDIEVSLKQNFSILPSLEENNGFEYKLSLILSGREQFRPYSKRTTIFNKDFIAVKKGYFLSGFELFDVRAKRALVVDKNFIKEIYPKTQNYYCSKDKIKKGERLQVLIYDY